MTCQSSCSSCNDGRTTTHRPPYRRPQTTVPVKLLPPVDVRSCPTVFRQSVRAELVSVVALLASAIVVGTAGWAGALPLPIAAVACTSLLAFAGIALVTARRSLRPTNWLVAVDGRRMLVNLRSYLDDGAPGDRSVLELRPGDVAGFRVTRFALTGTDAARDAVRDVSTFLDVVLDPSIDTSAIAEDLRARRDRRAGKVTWRHHPVTLPDRSTLRLEWRGRHTRIAPSVDEALRLLAPFGRPLDSRDERIDLGTSGIVPVNADAERAIRALADQGRIVDATALAVRSLGMSLTQARAHVERIRS